MLSDILIFAAGFGLAALTVAFIARETFAAREEMFRELIASSRDSHEAVSKMKEELHGS